MAEKTKNELIEDKYSSRLQSQTQQLTQDYDAGISDLNQQQEKNKQTTQQNLNRTSVESDRNRMNFAEVQQSQGLSSGAMAQARLAQDNQLQTDMATIRAAQQTADQAIETEKNLLGRQYQSAITAATAENDMLKAEELYKQAEKEEDRLLENQKTAAQAMASVGDFSLFGSLYGLTDEQVSTLGTDYQNTKNKETEERNRQNMETAAQTLAAAGDFSLFGQVYGLTPEQVTYLNDQYKSEADKETNAQSRQDQEAAAQAMAASGDFTLFGQLYGLSDEQVTYLNNQYKEEQNQQSYSQTRQDQEVAAQAMASIGDYSLFGQLYGLTDEQVAKLNADFQAAVSKETEEEKYQRELSAAELMASIGDFSLIAKLFNLTPEQEAAVAAAYAQENGTSSDDNGKPNEEPNEEPDEETNKNTDAILAKIKKEYPNKVITNPVDWMIAVGSFTSDGEKILNEAGFVYAPSGR